MAIYNFDITSSANDGQWNELDSSWNPRTNEGYAEGEFFEVKADPGSTDSKWGAVRFENLSQFPNAASITSATLRLEVTGKSGDDAGATVRVFGDVGTSRSAALSASHNPQVGWTNSTAFADIDISALTPPVTVNLDVTSIVQEILNLAGWVAGDDICFGMDAEIEGTDAYFSANIVDYDSDTLATVARLTVDYTDGASIPVFMNHYRMRG